MPRIWIFLPDPGCSLSIIDIKMINLSTMGGGGGAGYSLI